MERFRVEKAGVSRAVFLSKFLWNLSYKTVPLMIKLRGIFPNFARLDAALLELYLTPLSTVEQPDLAPFFLVSSTQGCLISKFSYTIAK